MEVRASDHSCGEIAQIIQQNKNVFVRVGLGGRSFRYPPRSAAWATSAPTTSFGDGEGKSCVLDHACVFDPASPYMFPREGCDFRIRPQRQSSCRTDIVIAKPLESSPLLLHSEVFMKHVALAVALLFPSAALAAEAVEVNARDHSCAELAQIIRKERAVFVRMGIGGRSFRYPPARCNLGDKYDTATVRDADGKMCRLDYECVYDPQSFYNRIPK